MSLTFCVFCSQAHKPHPGGSQQAPAGQRGRYRDHHVLRGGRTPQSGHQVDAWRRGHHLQQQRRQLAHR